MKTVLIVDDEELFLASLTDGLSAYADEFAVITATNGKHAIEVLTAQPIALVVTDLKMPEMDGFQLLAQIVNSQVNMPVIVMTAFGTPDIEDRLTDNVFGYLEKPIDFQVLAGKIRRGLMQTAWGYSHSIT